MSDAPRPRQGPCSPRAARSKPGAVSSIDLRRGTGVIVRGARRWLWALALGGSVASAPGCGGGEAGPAVGLSARPRTAADARTPGDAEETGFLPAHDVGALDDDRALASFARRDDGRGVLVFVQGGALRARALDARGAPAGEPAAIAPLPAGATHLALRQTGDGYLVAWGAPADAGTQIAVLALDADGRARGAVVPVARVAEPAAFVDVVASGAAGFVVHEVLGRGARGTSSRVTVTPVDPARGTTAGPAVVVADGAIGWSVVATPRGAAAARVLAPPPAAPAAPGQTPSLGPSLGRLEVVTIDPRGAAGAPIVVRAEPTANIDVELASLGDHLLVAWTDGAEAAGAVTVASIDGAGKATTPRRLSPPGADAALVGTWAAGAAARRALIAWESIDPGRGAEAPRTFTLATVDGTGAASPSAGTLAFVGPGRPDVVADGDGYAALVLAPAAGAAEPDAPVWPTFVRLGPDLAVRAQDGVRAEPFAATDGVPDLAFGLACAAGGCIAIAGAAGAPAPLVAVELAAPAGAAAPARTAPAADAARPAATPRPAAPVVPAGPELATVLWSGERLADVAAARLEGGAELVAWVGWHEPGVTTTAPPPKGEKPFAATLAVRTTTGGPEVAPVVISQRATSAGGVSLAPVPGAAGEAVLGWVASEDGIGQVFATRLDAAGKKIAQKKVTVVDRGTKARPRSTCSAVDVAFAAQASDGRPGVVIGWIDTRDGDAEVYAARLDARMQKVGADRRITTARGEATEVKVLVRGAETWVAFVEARDGAPTGDVYLTVLRTGNLEPLGEPVRVFDAPGRAHGLRFVEGAGGRVLLSWVDDAPSAGGGEPGVRLVEIVGGKPSGAPRRVAALGGVVLDAGFGCASGACRGVGAGGSGTPRLLAVDADAAGSAGGARDVGSAHPTRLVIAPIAGDGSGFVIADDDGRAGRVRLLRTPR